ncbi:DUF368 domain-containing protein [Aliidiomarina quisquiliarum]|uniref:DUF368 domain-containing protein n=1 Tax=Aliidiomarina quisquiliarum TaxID=2938947 RepID=UPI00208EEEBD|nr:DUF368 domain-containing protein [Aliidiomarina quisquiliarum]MCO4320320.1 DUF368 domain-containing protein [Aliidiomarina quisquiliarum]
MNQYWKLFVKGMAMGAADVVPGVSGGTLAFILGVYERLLSALASVNIAAIKLLLSGQIKLAWRHIDGTFLLCLFGGILVSIFSLTNIITYMLQHQPVPLWAFFNGLILASLPILIRNVTWNWQRGLWFVVGTIIATCITLLTPMQSDPTPWMFFGAGFIAICAMILPGISGSFLLLIMGMYIPITTAVSNLNISLLLLFALGCFSGLMAFSRLLKWALQRAQNAMLAFLSGIVLGALYRIWPWQINDQLVSPASYAEAFGSAQLLLAAVAFALGIGALLLLRLLEKKP